MARNPKLLNIVRTSKFHHIEGIVMHKSTHIDSIPELCRTVPGDSNAVSANSDRMATALKQAGGQIAVLEVRMLLLQAVQNDLRMNPDWSRYIGTSSMASLIHAVIWTFLAKCN